eukprot:CAMPEP_0179106112 /NCGR_PEP_ID=MMETSP0796-20121207/49315_1 /TAXON_ID=73915 /ORGANISM="Pyrodinium bahamense, Strain pbaha01" /LENGTH=217 /DNA_ID=CAMNT_0020804119 /DNA_START=55 /DNA_END=708 /DNA_ORIENTATION=+
MATAATLSSTDFPAIRHVAAPNTSRRKGARMPRLRREMTVGDDVLQGWTLCDDADSEGWVLCEAEAEAKLQEGGLAGVTSEQPCGKASMASELEPAIKAGILRQVEEAEESEDDEPEEDAEDVGAAPGEEGAGQQAATSSDSAATGAQPKKPEVPAKHRTRAERKVLWKLLQANQAEKEGLVGGKSSAAADKAEEECAERKLQRGARRHDRRNRREN